MYVTIESQNKITKDTLILFMGLFYPAIHNYIWRVVVAFTRVAGIYFSLDMFDVVVWTIIIGYIVLSARKTTVTAKTLMISLLFIFVTFLCFTFTNYEYFTVSVLFTLLLGTFSFFIQGSLINIKRVSHKQLYIAALVTLIMSMAYSVYSVDSSNLKLEDNMDFAYKVLPSVLMIISWLFTNRKKKLAVVFSIIGTVFLLLQGTRGPLLCLAIFVCLMLYKKHGLGKFFFKIGTIVLILVIMFSSQLVKLKLVELSDKIDSSGYSSRFIIMMIEGELSDSNGRDAIKGKLLREIKEDPIKIRGMFADRQATRGLIDREYDTSYSKGTYAHSLWIELIYDWGVILGGALFLLLVLAVLKLIGKCDMDDAYIVMFFVCTGFVHLFLSGSYLSSANFFFLMGVLVNYRTNKIRVKKGG